MTEVAEHFLFLESEARQIAGSQLLTRATGSLVGVREVLIAIDVAGQRHLLIPVSTDRVAGDQASQGVTLGQRVLRTTSGDVTYADLHCRIPALGIVFERLAEDVLQRLAADDSAPVTTCRRVLDEWRALLRAAGQEISRETVIGLIGELEVLRRFAAHNPLDALDAWLVPSRSVHDFVRGSTEIEVKTTTSVDGNYITISNIDQLDPALVESLHLVVVHVRADATSPTLDERIEELLRMGLPRDTLLSKVASTGYVYGAGPAIEDRYRVRSVRAWTVNDSFPGLRRAELGETRLRGISKIRYEVALDSMPKRMSDNDFEQFTREWLGVGR